MKKTDVRVEYLKWKKTNKNDLNENKLRVSFTFYTETVCSVWPENDNATRQFNAIQKLSQLETTTFMTKLYGNSNIIKSNASETNAVSTND